MHIRNYGLRVVANVPMEDVWGCTEDAQRAVESYRTEIRKLVEFYGVNSEEAVPNLIDLPIQLVFLDEDSQRSWCGSGRSMIGFDLDGTPLPCHRYARMSFDQRLFAVPLKLSKSRCFTCRFRPCCQTCEANNWQVNCNPNVRTSYHCMFSQIQVWGTACVRLIRLEKRTAALIASKDPERRHSVGSALQECLRDAEIVRRVLIELKRLADLGDSGTSLATAGDTELMLVPRWSIEAVMKPLQASVSSHVKCNRRGGRRDT
jgi:hypothetical protein